MRYRFLKELNRGGLDGELREALGGAIAAIGIGREEGNEGNEESVRLEGLLQLERVVELWIAVSTLLHLHRKSWKMSYVGRR